MICAGGHRKGACFVTNTPKRNTLEVVSSITEQPTNISVLTTGPDKLRDQLSWVQFHRSCPHLPPQFSELQEDICTQMRDQIWPLWAIQDVQEVRGRKVQFVLHDTTTNPFLSEVQLGRFPVRDIICPTFQAPAASSRPLSNALMSERWPRVPPSVTFKPLFKSCFLDSPFALPSAAAARRRVGRRGHCLPVSGYTTQACCCDNNSPLSPVLFYPTNPNQWWQLSLSSLRVCVSVCLLCPTY